MSDEVDGFDDSGSDDDRDCCPHHRQRRSNQQVDDGVVGELALERLDDLGETPLPGPRNLMQRVRRFESLPGHCDQSGRPPDYESCKREDGAGKPSDCGQTSLQHGIPFPANGAFDDEGASSTQWAGQDRERNARLMELAATRQLPARSP
jgi:hypothetical protein